MIQNFHAGYQLFEDILTAIAERSLNPAESLESHLGIYSIIYVMRIIICVVFQLDSRHKSHNSHGYSDSPDDLP
jgi:hypothetical protein